MAGRPRTRAKHVAAELAANEQAAASHPEPAAGAASSPPPSRDRPPRSRKRRPDGATAPRPDAPAAASPTTETSDRRPVGIRKIHDGLVQLFTLAGLGVAAFADDFSGQVVALNAERLARAWSDLAAQNAYVRRALEALLQGSAWGAAIGSTAMVAVPILVRYGVAPPDVMAIAASQGVKLPDYGQQSSAERPPAPASFTPSDPAPAPAEVPHPFDSGVTPDSTNQNGQPDQAPVFPHDPPA